MIVSEDWIIFVSAFVLLVMPFVLARTRLCPFCQSRIFRRATKCRRCGSDVERDNSFPWDAVRFALFDLAFVAVAYWLMSDSLTPAIPSAPKVSETTPPAVVVAVSATPKPMVSPLRANQISTPSPRQISEEIARKYGAK